MDIEQKTQTSIPILCNECWYHISDFNNFQQSVLQVQAKFLEDCEQSEETLPNPNSTETLPSTSDRGLLKNSENDEQISIASSENDLSDSVEDSEHILPKDETVELEKEFAIIKDMEQVKSEKESLGTFEDSLIELDETIEIEEEFQMIENVEPVKSGTEPFESFEICDNAVTDNISAENKATEINDISVNTIIPRHVSDEMNFQDALIDNPSEVHGIKDINNIFIKEEEPLEVVDIYVVDEVDDNDDNDLLYNSDYSSDISESAFETFKVLYNSANSSDSYKPVKPKKPKKPINHTPKFKRTPAEDLDDVIAQWMPTLECKCCQETYSTFTGLQRHFRKMHTKDEFSITCCKKVFKTRKYLEEHVRLHLNPKAFQCRFCMKCCPAKQNLTSHIAHMHPESLETTNLQQKEAKYKCNICDKAFTVPFALRQHSAIHSEEREYKCSHCDKTFKYRSNVLHHINSVHLKTMKQAKFFRKCVHCNKNIICRTSMYPHMKKYHPEEIAKEKNIWKHMLKP